MPLLDIQVRGVGHAGVADGGAGQSAGGRGGDKAPEVAVLLSVYHGSRFLPRQLDSLLTQTYARWSLVWRDDGPSDTDQKILGEFARLAGEDRVAFVSRGGHLGATQSYMCLLRAAVAGPFDIFSFSDQDDVWLPGKIARGVAALAKIPQDVPALYFARQEVVDELLRPLGLSPQARATKFPASLAQNIATGCTVMLNRAGAQLALSVAPPAGTFHDWWCYLLVSAAGGLVLEDPAPVLLYRQHSKNHIGFDTSATRRAVRALARGPKPFMSLLRAHVAALQSAPEIMSESARAAVSVISRGLLGGPFDRIQALRLSGLRRQAHLESVLFWIWFLVG